MNTINCYATPTEIENFCQENKLKLTEVKHAQVCYLYHIAKIARKDISAITKYAISTLSKLRNKVLDLVDKAREWFEGEPKQEKTYHTNHVKITYHQECEADKKVPCAYLFKFYDEEKILFSKIGTTKVGCLKRLKQEIKYYTEKNNFHITSAEITSIYPSGILPPESYESYLRSCLMISHQGVWRKNDRFFDTDISRKEFLTLCKNFNNLLKE